MTATEDGLTGVASSGNEYTIDETGIHLERPDGSTVDVNAQVSDFNDQIEIHFGN